MNSDKENTHKTHKFGNRIKARINNTLVSKESNILQPLSLQSPSIPPIRFSKDYTNTLEELNLSTSSLMTKRNKSVKFDEIPSCKPDKKPAIKNPISILKNSMSGEKSLSNLGESRNLNSSFCSYNSQRSKLSASDSVVEDQQYKCINKDKFNTLLESHASQNMRYFDDIFPPGESSVYFKRGQTTYGDIKWVRLGELYRGYKLGIYTCDRLKKSMIQRGVADIPYMVTCLNALDHSPRCLERVFEEQAVNEVGLYCLRIFVNGIWRYVMVDDFVPTVTVNKKQEPLFLKVVPNKVYLNIWPFLVQKAYAKVYGSYEALLNGNLLDFMNELTGASVEILPLNSPNASLQLKKQLSNSQSILIFGKKTPSQTLYSFSDSGRSSGYISSFLCDQTISIDNKDYEISDIVQQFDEAIVTKVDECYYSVGCTIHQSKEIPLSIRSFKVESNTVCDISLIQKDNKFFINYGYQYSWIRLVIALKQTEGFRYIAGGFSNSKSVHLNCVLDPGEYYAIVIVEWEKRAYNVCLSYNGTSCITFERKVIKEVPNLLEETCADIAQRFGEFKQLSPNLCSYRYADPQLGLLIENINNENSSREVALIKSYVEVLKEAELVGCVQCFDKEFVGHNFVISRRIKAKDHYTLVMRLKGVKGMKALSHFQFDQ